MEEKNQTLTTKQKRDLERTNRIKALMKINVLARNQVGFACRMLVQCNLPHSDPGNDVQMWTRANGNACLTIKPGHYVQNGKTHPIGFPYGNIPRLIMFYLCTEAIQKREKVICLGDSLSAFMRNIGLEVTGGEQGTIRRFKEQMWRLLACSIFFTLDSQELKILENAQIAHKVKLLWDTQQPEEESLSSSYIELSQDFINEIWAYPVPIDLGIIAAIKQSSLALDLYAWLTHRVTYLNKNTFISWQSIAGQVGSQYKDIKDFKKRAKEELQKICAVWPSLNLKEVRGGIMLMPSSPSVPYKKP
jgi:hypothetical protein